MRNILCAAAFLAAWGVAHAGTPVALYDSVGGAENGGDTFGTAGDLMLAEIGPATNVKLAKIELNVRLKHADAGSFDVIYAVVSGNGKPTKRKVIATVQDSTLSTTFQLVKVSGHGLGLLNSQRYYVGIARHKGSPSSVVFGNTVDRAVLKRASVKAGGYYYNSAGGRQKNSGGPYEMQVFVNTRK